MRRCEGALRRACAHRSTAPSPNARYQCLARRFHQGHLHCQQQHSQSTKSTIPPPPSKSLSPVRVRYAPSPTGSVHLGGLRTALYNYLLARQLKDNGRGTFLLRIEDTDQKRLVPGAVDNLLSVLHWSGLDIDEGPGSLGGDYGPYVQSERLPLYRDAAMTLVKHGHAYPCFCSPDRLTQLRELQIKKGLATNYDRLCAGHSIEKQLELMDNADKSNTPYTIRMKIPPGTTTMCDTIRGRVQFANKSLDDQVLLKSDRFPTYHLAVVVDDHAMKISHVIRGEEWLPSSPKHILLYKMFGWPVPLFAHLPLLLKGDGTKLSKRHDDASVEHYIEQGYLPEAIVNFVALLGWNPGVTKEVFTMAELIESFSLARIQKHGAVVNSDKLKWFNQQHLRLRIQHSLPELVQSLRPMLVAKYGTSINDSQIESAFMTLKEHVTFTQHLIDYSHYFFQTPRYDSDEAVRAMAKVVNPSLYGDYQQWLELMSVRLTECEFTDGKEIFAALKMCHEALGCGQKSLLSLLRLAVTGQEVGPSMSEICLALGKDTVVARLTAFKSVLAAETQSTIQRPAAVPMT